VGRRLDGVAVQQPLGSTPSFWSICSSAQEAISKLEPSCSNADSSSGSELHFTA
jgi:hypothetical protein